MERLKELIDRMVAPGPAFAHLSASEGHEIRQGCLDLITALADLASAADAFRGFQDDDESADKTSADLDASITRAVTLLHPSPFAK